jgi:hypothetical protein
MGMIKREMRMTWLSKVSRIRYKGKLAWEEKN